MAVQSRPSLRSTSRRKAGFEEVPPTDIQQNPLPATRRGKRPRDHSLGRESNASVKRQRSSPPKKADASIDVPKSRALKSLPLRDKAGTQNAVTSRPRDPPPQQINGFTSTTTNSLTKHNAQSFARNNHLASDNTNSASQNGKRSLRSHDGGSQSKSELALYFPNYDELVSIEPKEPEFLTAETLLYITDEPSNSKPIPTSTSNHATTKSRPSTSSYPPTTNGSSPTLKYPPATFTTLTSATRLDLALLPPPAPHLPDPLPPTLYHAPHRRAQRAEKQLRNIEKERAMHEKVQLERLLDGLKGHDWLRTMGISGITDSEKKLYEPKREFFVNEVRVLLKKFQQWKEEEKRRKVEKEESMMDEDEEQDEDDDDDKSDDNPPDYNDVDASPTRQLHREALLSTPTSRSHHKKTPSSSLPQPPPFTTFYTKPYLREAAISRHRRGRARYAFGQPLPEPAEREFELGGEILTGEVVERVERGRRGGG